MKKYVIFDIDGTLNQTALYAIEAYQKALKKEILLLVMMLFLLVLV